jgi:hypothetical protein
MSEERGEFYTDVDGYVYWWPESLGGHLASHHLRWLADELDKRNHKWDQTIANDPVFQDKPNYGRLAWIYIVGASVVVWVVVLVELLIKWLK